MRVAINGFGRIGRLVLRAALKRQVGIDFVAVNDITDAKTLAHLLHYDSVHGAWPERFAADGANITVGGKSIRALCESNPAALPRKHMANEDDMEITGKITERDKRT